MIDKEGFMQGWSAAFSTLLKLRKQNQNDDAKSLLDAFRKTNPKAILEGLSLVCPECGGHALLKETKYGLMYSCARWPDCDTCVGAYEGGTPKGTLANPETRTARQEAHAAFDQLWKSDYMKRREAYVWFQKTMELTEDQAHIAKLDLEGCKKLVRLADEEFAQVP